MSVSCDAGGEVCDLALQQACSDSHAGSQHPDLGAAIWEDPARPHGDLLHYGYPVEPTRS